MNSSKRHFPSGLKLFFAAAIVWTSSNANAADRYVPFAGEKTTWHEGFDRYDFMMDDATGAITPMKAPEKEVTSFGVDVSIKDGKRRCIVVVPKKAAPGNPWSWQACYWNHQPQTEVELLRRGFHIAFVAPDPVGQGKAWDLWYKFMTETHGLAKKSAFIGMSKGGVNEFNWVGPTLTRWPVSTRTIRRSTTMITSKSRCWPNMTYLSCTSSALRILCCGTLWQWRRYITSWAAQS